MVDPGRREPERVGRRPVPGRRREHLAHRAAARPHRRRESVSNPRAPRLRRARRLRRQHPQPAAGDRVRVPVRAEGSRRHDRTDEPHGEGENAHRARAIARRADAARLSARLSGTAAGAQFHQPAAGLLRRGPRRLERRVGASRATRRHHPHARRSLQIRAAELRRSPHGAVRRHDGAHARRHRRSSHHDRGRR